MGLILELTEHIHCLNGTCDLDTNYTEEGGRTFFWNVYRGADKSLARPTSPCVLFDGENISFDASLVIYINSTNIPPIIITNRVPGC